MSSANDTDSEVVINDCKWGHITSDENPVQSDWETTVRACEGKTAATSWDIPPEQRSTTTAEGNVNAIDSVAIIMPNTKNHIAEASPGTSATAEMH